MDSRVPLGMQHLGLTVVTICASEAICESFGSTMEHYHKNRFTNCGEDNDDPRLQREMFVRLNGPPMVHAGPFIRKVASRMISGVPYTDTVRQGKMRKVRFATKKYLEGGYRDNLTSVELRNISKNLEGDRGRNRKGILAKF